MASIVSDSPGGGAGVEALSRAIAAAALGVGVAEAGDHLVVGPPVAGLQIPLDGAPRPGWVPGVTRTAWRDDRGAAHLRAAGAWGEVRIDLGPDALVVTAARGARAARVIAPWGGG